MSSSYQDRFPVILKDYLGTELYLAAKDRGIKDNRMMHWYHVLGRDQELLKERVEDALQKSEELHQVLEENIENMKEQIQTMKLMQTQTVEDLVYQE